MKTKSYQEIISELLSENYKSSLENYGLLFQHELWHVRGYFRQRRAAPEDISKIAEFLVKIIEDNRDKTLLKLSSIKNEIIFERCSETKHPDFFDVFNLYYKWSKKEFFLKLKDEGLPELMLKDIFPIIFLVSLGEYVLTQKDTVRNSEHSLEINKQQMNWVKVASKAYQEFNSKNSWSPIEHSNSYNSWERQGGFSEPETLFHEWDKVSDQRNLVLMKELSSRQKGGGTTTKQEAKKIAFDFYKKNKNNKTFYNKKGGLVKAKIINDICLHLQEKGHSVSEETIKKNWYKEFENGSNRKILGFKTKVLISEINKLEKYRKTIMCPSSNK